MYPDYLMHHGVKGMKWGVRKKNYDSQGNLTKRGRKRQNLLDSKRNAISTAMKKANSAANYDRRVIADLKKNGYKSKHFKEIADDYDENTLKDKSFKKYLMDYKIDSHKESLEYYSDTGKQAANALKSLDKITIDDPDFKKKVRAYSGW